MKHNQNGAINLMVPLIASVALVLVLGVFLLIELGNVNKYKNNADQLISAAVTKAKSEQQNTDNKLFFIEYQKPYTTYNGPQDLGSIVFNYPKTWSSYVETNQQDGNSNPLDGFFYPKTLPTIQNEAATNYALRIRIVAQTYSDTLNNYQGTVQQYGGTINPYSLPKLPNIVGVKVSGKLDSGKNGTLVLMPLRNETIEIWTEGDQFGSEFNNILASFTFSP